MWKARGRRGSIRAIHGQHGRRGRSYEFLRLMRLVRGQVRSRGPVRMLYLYKHRSVRPLYGGIPKEWDGEDGCL